LIPSAAGLLEGDLNIFNIILGLTLLLFGRKLFWLFVAIAGFLVGLEFTGVILVDQPQWVLLLVALGAGLFGALLAVFVERAAFALAGFYAGAYLVLIVAQSFGVGGNSMVLFVTGGVIGAVFAVLIMDWTIIVLSCLVGAGAIVEGLDLGQTMGTIVFVALAIFGAFVQAKLITPSDTANGPADGPREIEAKSLNELFKHGSNKDKRK
jgi:hypothetical protein